MEIDEQRRGPGSPAGEAPEGASAATRRNGERKFGPERAGRILGEWRQRELRIARGFPECRGLSTEELEDIYQETALALYRRAYDSEAHLRNALRDGIKKRALRLRRDERIHRRAVQRGTPHLRGMAQAREREGAPELAALAREDRLIASEFTTELTEEERRVFGGLVEGMSYRAIATALQIPENEARNNMRACERKRERFQLLYATGRLCGYRAQTIQALQSGAGTSEELAERAFAHLESCARCRIEHRTNAKRLRASFRDQAAALLPPVFIGNLGRLQRLGVRARLLAHRLGIDRAASGQGGVRERTIAVLAGAGAGAKVAAGVIAVGVIAGGVIATHVLEQSPAHHPRAAHRQLIAPSKAATPRGGAPGAGAVSAPLAAPAPPSTPHPRSVHTSGRTGAPRAGVHRTVLATPRAATPSAPEQYEPGGFAYLGVPTRDSTASAEAPAASASEHQRGGGPFSP